MNFKVPCLLTSDVPYEFCGKWTWVPVNVSYYSCMTVFYRFLFYLVHYQFANSVSWYSAQRHVGLWTWRWKVGHTGSWNKTTNCSSATHCLHSPQNKRRKREGKGEVKRNPLILLFILKLFPTDLPPFPFSPFFIFLSRFFAESEQTLKRPLGLLCLSAGQHERKLACRKGETTPHTLKTLTWLIHIIHTGRPQNTEK